MTDTPVRALQTVEDLADFYENLLDDAPDRDLTLQLLSTAKNRIEVENDLYVLQDEDTTQIAGTGDTYLNTHPLPDRWRKTRYMRIGSGRPGRFLHPTSFAKRMIGEANRYFVDYRNKLFGFTGQVGSGGTIYHGFMRATDDFVAANEDSALDDVLEWPTEYAPVIVFEALGFYQTGVDTDSISSQQGNINLARAQNLLDAFIGWDQDQKLAEMDNAGGYADGYGDEDGISPSEFVGSLPG